VGQTGNGPQRKAKRGEVLDSLRNRLHQVRDSDLASFPLQDARQSNSLRGDNLSAEAWRKSAGDPVITQAAL
jgi:hypothetical protein